MIDTAIELAKLLAKLAVAAVRPKPGPKVEPLPPKAPRANGRP